MPKEHEIPKLCSQNNDDDDDDTNFTTFMNGNEFYHICSSKLRKSFWANTILRFPAWIIDKEVLQTTNDGAPIIELTMWQRRLKYMQACWFRSLTLSFINKNCEANSQWEFCSLESKWHACWFDWKPVMWVVYFTWGDNVFQANLDLLHYLGVSKILRSIIKTLTFRLKKTLCRGVPIGSTELRNTFG